MNNTLAERRRSPRWVPDNAALDDNLAAYCELHTSIKLTAMQQKLRRAGTNGERYGVVNALIAKVDLPQLTNFIERWPLASVEQSRRVGAEADERLYTSGVEVGVLVLRGVAAPQHEHAVIDRNVASGDNRHLAMSELSDLVNPCCE